MEPGWCDVQNVQSGYRRSAGGDYLEYQDEIAVVRGRVEPIPRFPITAT